MRCSSCFSGQPYEVKLSQVNVGGCNARIGSSCVSVIHSICLGSSHSYTNCLLPQPTEFNTCVFKLEVKNPVDPADMPHPMPNGTSYAAGPRRTMNVFRYRIDAVNSASTRNISVVPCR